MFRYLAVVLYAPHLLLYFFSAQKSVIVADLYARKRVVGKSEITKSIDLCEELFRSRYFRTLFYFRTHGLFSKLLRIFYPQCDNFIIDIHTRIGEGLQLAHPYATIINAESVGKHCYINHLVTIGEKDGKRPVIGNAVTFHANCIVIGGITIGDHAVIGAGAVVIKDVPAHALAIGNPARIIVK